MNWGNRCRRWSKKGAYCCSGCVCFHFCSDRRKRKPDRQQNRVEASGADEQSVRGEGSETNILIAYFTRAENTHVENPEAVDVDAATSASVLPPGNMAKMAGWIHERVGGDLFSIVVTEPYSEDYAVIFLGFPNWWYTALMAVFSFIEEYDLSGKTVIPLCAHGTGGLASSVKDITEALPDSAQPVINEWLDSLGYTEESMTQAQETSAEGGSLPIVYITNEISAEGLMAVYEALDASPSGRIAVKLSTGEPGSNYLRTDLIGDFVMSLENPTIVECNIAYRGSRANTAMHYQVAEDRGYTAIADVDIMDENGSMAFSAEGGDNLTENYVGAHFANYEYYVILSHFKGHTMAEAGKSVVDYLDGNISL